MQVMLQKAPHYCAHAHCTLTIGQPGRAYRDYAAIMLNTAPHHCARMPTVHYRGSASSERLNGATRLSYSHERFLGQPG